MVDERGLAIVGSLAWHASRSVCPHGKTRAILVRRASFEAASGAVLTAPSSRGWASGGSLAAMILTVDLSMYPFDRDYRVLIKEFVAKLDTYTDLRVTTGPTSTVIVGDYARVMESLGDAMKWSHDTHGKAVFVAKLIPDYDAP
ncbi:MAG: hypothetical protein WBG86_05710 [Polyangiales bacterium]